MLQNLNALLAPALMDRLVLVVNHVLAAEPQAVARMLPHQGRVLRLELLQLPRLLPAPPPAVLALQALGGQMPPVVIEGDASLAADVDWLLKNLRWDVADDLQRLFGPTVAHELHRLGAGLARAVGKAMHGARQGAEAASRMRPR